MLLTHEEVRQLPSFISHTEAKDYFRKRYGSQFFVFYSGDRENGNKIYFCYLIPANGITQRIKIHQNGRVEIEC